MNSDISSFISNVQQLQLARYLNVAIFAIFVADYFHTLTTEINLLWPAPWTIIKVLFLFSRYTPFLDGPAALAIRSLSPPSSDVCTHLLSIENWLGSIGANCSQLLLVYRAYALVGRTRLSSILFSLLALVMILITLSLTILVQEGIEPAGQNVPPIFPKCGINMASIRIDVATPIVTIIYETIIFGAVYWAKVKKYKEEENWLIRRIYRDAFMYYLLLLIVSITSLTTWLTTSGPLSIIPPSLQRYFLSIISSRIILNIRQYASVQRTLTDTGPTAATLGEESTWPVSGIRFANMSGHRHVSVVDTQLRLY